VGRHDAALRILYCDSNSLDVALEYCDDWYALQKLQQLKAMMMLNRRSGGRARRLLEKVGDTKQSKLRRPSCKSLSKQLSLDTTRQTSICKKATSRTEWPLHGQQPRDGTEDRRIKGVVYRRGNNRFSSSTNTTTTEMGTSRTAYWRPGWPIG
jgi:hypothetical protein